MSYFQKFYITNPARFGRFVGKKWTNVNKIVQPLGVRADKGEDSRGVHIRLSASKVNRHLVDKALRLLQERQSATSRRNRPASTAGPSRPAPPAPPASYSRKFYVETHVLQPEVDFARFVGKRWNNINRILNTVKSTVRSREDPTKTIKKSLVRADKGEDELGVYVVLSAPRTHSKKVDMAHLLLQQRQQKCTTHDTRDRRRLIYRPAVPRPTLAQCKGPIVVQRQRPAPSQPRPTPCDRPMTPQQSAKPAVVMPPPPPPEAIAAAVALDKALREEASFDVTRCSDPARSDQPTHPAPPFGADLPQQDATWQNWIEKTEEFSLFSTPMPRYSRKSVVTVADVARGLQDLPATTDYKSAPGSTAASVTGEPSYPASVASDHDAPTEQYPSLPAVPAPKFCPTKCMARLNKLHVAKRVVQRKRTQTDQRNCKGSFNVGALEMGNKALERHLGKITEKINKRFGSSPGFYITGRRTSRTVRWTVRGSHVHSAFGQKLQEWYTGITAPHQAPTSDGTSTTASSEGPMSLDEFGDTYEFDALPTTQAPAQQPKKAPFFSKREKAALDMTLKQSLRVESLAGDIPSLCRRESHQDQAWSPTRTEPW